jgi:DNA (cytosine-5)-methyltransferase 1
VKDKMNLSAVDLFCGIGGLTHGLIKTGIDVIAGIDSDETCRYAFEKNNDAKFFNKDISKVSTEELINLYPEGSVRILVGCAPCQPFSKHTQKNRNREDDKKWGLLYPFSDLILKVRPDIVSMENVPQLTKQRVFRDFEKNLTSNGYEVSWELVYCPDYGIPQTRTRLVLFASKLGKINLIAKTHSPSRYKTVRSAIGDLEKIEDGEISKKDLLHKAAKLSPVNKERMRQSVPGGTWRDWENDLISPCHAKMSGKTYSSVYSRMEWGKPAPTITTQFFGFGTGRFGHPEQDRALSLREGAILQTFPRSYRFCDKKNQLPFKTLGKHIGNAVPVRLGIVIGESIVKHMGDIYDK